MLGPVAAAARRGGPPLNAAVIGATGRGDYGHELDLALNGIEGVLVTSVADADPAGEDMLVLGVHLLDLMRMFAGDPIWCTARIEQSGHPITFKDAHEVKEAIGPVAGDEVFAQYALGNGVNATFSSRAKLREHVEHWGMELIGSRGSARIVADIWPSVCVLVPDRWEENGRNDAWRWPPIKAP